MSAVHDLTRRPPTRRILEQGLNRTARPPYELRVEDLAMAMQDVHDFFFDVNSRLVENRYFNGHPDLIVKGKYPNNSIKAGELGVEIKTTRKAGGAVDTHGARDQWMCVFVYEVDNEREPATERAPLRFASAAAASYAAD